MTTRIVALCALLCLSGAAVGVFTASNNVPSTSVGRQQFTIDANALKPVTCTMNLADVVTNGNGTAGNDLILADASGMTLAGNGGQDCMIGGAGNDTFDGNGKNAGDVCIGNAGSDTNHANKCQFFTQ